MCNKEHEKHNYKHHHCHKHEKNVGETVERREKCECKKHEENSGKFDWKKYCHKKHACNTEHKEENHGYSDLKFIPSGYGHQVADVRLKNGFDLRIIRGKDLIVEDIELSYNYFETGKRLSIFQVFPQLVDHKMKLRKAEDVMIIESALNLVNKLPGVNQEQFLDEVYYRIK